jgi:hypothetical protein
MPPRLSAAEKGKGRAKRAGASGGGGEEDAVPLASLIARLTRADLEALLLSHEEDLPELREEVSAKLQPEQVRSRDDHATPRAWPPWRVRALPLRPLRKGASVSARTASQGCTRRGRAAAARMRPAGACRRAARRRRLLQRKHWFKGAGFEHAWR